MDIDLSVLRLMEREKEIPFDELVQIIEQAILTAYLKHTNQADHRHGHSDQPPAARVHLDRKTGHVTVYVPERDDEGNVIGEAEDSPSDFGRIAAFAAKQVINQRLRDIADDAVLGEFRGREGDIVAGVIQQGPNPRMVHRVYVTSVAKGAKGPSITVSRTHPALVRKLFALEVPEIASGIVEIVSLAREAGHRTKIAVRATEPGVNAKGACIGELGQRVRAVTAELNNEKIDIVDYSPDLATFVSSALSPAKVTSAFVIDESLKAVRALVPDYQLSLAIGKEGQNARLAAKLTGAKIDIQPDSILDDK